MDSALLLLSRCVHAEKKKEKLAKSLEISFSDPIRSSVFSRGKPSLSGGRHREERAAANIEPSSSLNPSSFSSSLKRPPTFSTNMLLKDQNEDEEEVALLERSGSFVSPSLPLSVSSQHRPLLRAHTADSSLPSRPSRTTRL